jgi:3-oxoacyl-[acyl-carrier protein] reductase
VALVTGAATGIGAGIATRLAAGGAKVAVLDLDEGAAKRQAAEIGEGGGIAFGIAADVRDRASMESAFAATASEFGGLDIAVSNAGVIRDNLLFKMTDDDWSMVMDVHLRGAFLTAQIAQRYMVEAKYGRIICLSSTSARGNRGQANYSAAKAGLQGFVRTLALELGTYGITANAIAPGFIETAMTRATAERQGKSFDDLREVRGAAMPVRRIGQPEDIANAAAFFAAEESGFVTGQTLYVDGGSGLH